MKLSKFFFTKNNTKCKKKSTKSSQNVSNRLRTLTLTQDYWYLELTHVISSPLEVIVKWNKDSIEYLTMTVTQLRSSYDDGMALTKLSIETTQVEL